MKIWSKLAESTKKLYRRKGVTPQRYNAWVKTSKPQKERLARQGITRDEFLKATNTREVTRSAAVKAAEKHMIAVLPKVRIATIRKGLEAMDGSELYIARTASRDKLRKLASQSAYKQTPEGKYINPFWYN